MIFIYLALIFNIGMIILNKEPGMTINTFINKYKLQNNITDKICYSGRLDPMARGAIVLLIGDECKMMEIYNKKNKTYTFEIIFGLSTDTSDVMGLLLNKPIFPSVNSITDMVSSIKKYIGIHIGPETNIMQEFHDFSSIKYKGKSLWYYALNKIPIIKPRHKVMIYSANYKDIKKYNYNEWKNDICTKINNIDRKNNFRQDEIIEQYNKINLESSNIQLYSFPITISVSSGFYVRQFVTDIMKHINYPILTHDINRTCVELI